MPTLTSDLLLHDDELVTVDVKSIEQYVRATTTDGEEKYFDIIGPNTALKDEYVIADAPSLLPVDIRQMEPKQFWITYNAGGEVIYHLCPYKHRALYNRRADEVNRPSLMITIGDYTWRYVRRFETPYYPNLTDDCRVHDPGRYISNVAFLDGHAAMLTIEREINTSEYESDPFNF